MRNCLIILLSLFFMACGTCQPKTEVVVKTKVIVPTIACAKPLPYAQFREESLISTENVHSEGVLFEVISKNVKMMERQIMLWENYKDCVEKILKEYSDEKDKVQLESSDN